MPKWRFALRLCFWNLVVLLAAALVLEIAFGTWVFGPNFGYLNVPRNVALRHDLGRIAPGGGVAVYRKDRYGFRGAYADPADIDVLVIGGSTTNELYVGEGDTWVDVLRAAFAAEGRDIVMVNAGVDGHSTRAHIRSFDAWFRHVPGLRPAYVLAYVGINDVDLGSQDQYDRLEDDGLWRGLRRQIANNSAIYNLFRAIRGYIRARELRVVHGERREFRETARRTFDPARWRAEVVAYGVRLRELARRIAAFGGRPIFVTQLRGDAFDIGGRTIVSFADAYAIREKLKLFNARTMAVCRAVGGICVDLAAELRPAPEDFYDRVHTRPSGSRKIGLYLYSRLKDKL